MYNIFLSPALATATLATSAALASSASAATLAAASSAASLAAFAAALTTSNFSFASLIAYINGFLVNAVSVSVFVIFIIAEYLTAALFAASSASPACFFATSSFPFFSASSARRLASSANSTSFAI